LWLLIRKSIWCWPFGILSSLLSIWLFFEVKLYSEAILYAFYVLFGIYGWYNWHQDLQSQASENNTAEIHIIRASNQFLVAGSFVAVILALGIGYLWSSRSDAAYPYADAFTTNFALLATWLESKRIFEHWFFWILINAASSAIYYLKDLHIYAALMLLYFGMSLWGWYSWRKDIRTANTSQK
jgi:nicotinamide mononucleotide transporter